MSSFIPVADLRRLDALCNEYEDAWCPTAAEDFGHYLQRVSPSLASDLLNMLVEVDLELRQKAGLEVSPAVYLSAGTEASEIAAGLLASDPHGSDAGTIQADADPVTPTQLSSDNETINERLSIPSYQLIRKIGEGGMGTVWLAEQQEPIRRQVAIKVVKAGVDSGEIMRRLEAERQALAVMNHPNIARIFEAGATNSGSPYFVMELVDGLPLTEHCDRQRLTIHQRLRLFCNVCSGVEHAHQKGVIHRDLKPSNILVADVDGVPTPKIIDFGLVRSLDRQQRLSDDSLFTRFGQVLGTLKYMSPEQAGLTTFDIDTRSDIYSLGVVLYELLTGATPLGAELTRHRSVLESLQIIRDLEPAKPSVRISGPRHEVEDIATNRGTDAVHLKRLVSGDLDWIAMKALDKDRSRRYATASGLAADIQRFLNDDPVQARPPSSTYRLQKFLRKNRVTVGAGMGLALALIAGMIGTTWGWLKSRQSEHEAVHQFVKAETARQLEREAKDKADKRLTQIENSNDALTSVFDDLDMNAVRSGSEPLEAVLAKRLVIAAEKIQGDAVGDPLIVASMQERLAKSLHSLGFRKEANELFARSLATMRATLDADDVRILTTQASLAESLRAVGEVAESIKLYEKTYPLIQAQLGDDHPDTMIALTGLAKAYHAAGNPQRGFALYEQAFQRRREQLGDRNPDTLKAMNGLAGMYYSNRELGKALPLFQEVLRLRIEVLGDNHKDTLNVMNNLASVYQSLGDHTQAIPLFEKNDRLTRATLGSEHPQTLNGVTNLANAYRTAGRPDDAIRVFEDHLDLMTKNMGDDHPLTLSFLNNLALAYVETMQFDRAIPLYQSTLESRKRKLGEDHPETLITMNNLAGAYSKTGQRDQSIPLYADVLRRREQTLGRKHESTQRTVCRLGSDYVDEGRFEEGISLLEEAAQSFDRNPELSRALAALRKGYLRANRMDDFNAAVKGHLELARQQFTEKSPKDLAEMLETIAADILDAGDAARATELLGEATELRTASAPENWEAFHTRFLLGNALLAQSQLADAAPHLLAGFEGLSARWKSIPPVERSKVVEKIEQIILQYESASQAADAQKWRERLDAVSVDRTP